MAKDPVKKRSAGLTPRSESGRLELISAMYERSMDQLSKMAEAGVAHVGMGFASTLGIFELLHGGAYAAPVNQLPYFMSDPSLSPYWAGDLKNVDVSGLGDFFAKVFGGSPNAAELYKALIVNANVPHVLPKLISDEVYALFLQGYVKYTATDLFSSAGTGIRTWVGAVTEAASIPGKLKGNPKGKAATQAARTAEARSDTAAQDIGGD